MAIKALVLDFDSTISTPIYLHRTKQWAVADNVALFQDMDTAEMTANLGGAQRIAALQALLTDLKNADVALHIISIGYRAAFVPHLHQLGLLRFFSDECVYGQDSPELVPVADSNPLNLSTEPVARVFVPPTTLLFFLVGFVLPCHSGRWAS